MSADFGWLLPLIYFTEIKGNEQAFLQKDDASSVEIQRVGAEESEESVMRITDLVRVCLYTVFCPNN